LKKSIKATIDCLGIGIIPLDFLVSIPEFPDKGGKVDAGDLCIQGGGPIPNAMVGLARLGYKTSIIAVVGDDMAGKISIDELKKEKINPRFVIRKKKPSASAFGFVEEGSGRRTIALHRKISITSKDLTLEKYPIPRMVHMDGRDLEANVKLAKWAKRNGALVSFDIGSVRNDVTRILPLVDHLAVADAFALPYTKTKNVKTALKKLSEICPGSIVITLGTKGAMALEEGKFYRSKAYKVSAVDTTGAGDAFHVGYLSGLLDGKDIEKRLDLGSLVAAIKCTKMGARGGMPTKRELDKFIKGKPKRYA